MKSIPFPPILLFLFAVLIMISISLRADDFNGELQSISDAAHTTIQKNDDDPKHFAKLVDRFVAIPNDPSQKDWDQLKTKKLDVLLTLLQAASHYVNLSGSVKKRPTANVPPPRATGLPAGVDPQAITDPMLRAQYEKDIAANWALAEESYKQADWQHIYVRLRAQLESYKEYFFADQESRVFDDKVNNAISNKPFLAKLLSEIGSQTQ